MEAGRLAGPQSPQHRISSPPREALMLQGAAGLCPGLGTEAADGDHQLPGRCLSSHAGVSVLPFVLYLTTGAQTIFLWKVTGL